MQLILPVILTQASDDDFFIRTIKTQQQAAIVHAVGVDKWISELEINGQAVKVKLDTGAKCNVIPKSIFNQIRSNDTLQKSNTKIVSYGGHKMDVCSEYKEKMYVLRFYVIDSDECPILGLKACQELNLIQRVNEMKLTTTESIMQEYADVFDNKTLGCLPVQHTINLKEDAKPVIHAPRKIPVAIPSKVKEELDRMQHLGVIEPVEEPTDWVSSMVTITKPNKTRICLDPRDLNNSIKREHYPLPTIEEIVSGLPQATVFSTLDATCGYWQIPVDEKSSKLLTFNTPYGRFRFRRLPFGISSASEVFQRTMNQLFGDIEGCEIIVDDILIWGRDEVEHDERLLKVLERARNIGLRLKEKRKFKVPKLKYIGHTLTADGLKPDPEKIEAVKKMPQHLRARKNFVGSSEWLTIWLNLFLT